MTRCRRCARTSARDGSYLVTGTPRSSAPHILQRVSRPAASAAEVLATAIEDDTERAGRDWGGEVSMSNSVQQERRPSAARRQCHRLQLDSFHYTCYVKSIITLRRPIKYRITFVMAQT